MRVTPDADNEEQSSRLLPALQQAGVSERVTRAMMQVPRERFVPPALGRYAWTDESLPIGNHQTISQPSLVGRMIDRLQTEPHHRVLDIGTGSGYQAAILSLLVETVVSVERIPALCIEAAERLHELGYRNVQVFDAGEELGWPELAPYDGIIVGAAAPEIPHSLISQLRIGGRLVIPVGNRDDQEIAIVRRNQTGVEIERGELVRFVPLIGKDAWQN